MLKVVGETDCSIPVMDRYKVIVKIIYFSIDLVDEQTSFNRYMGFVGLILMWISITIIILCTICLGRAIMVQSNI